MKKIKTLSYPLFDLPSPSSINLMWNFGFLLGTLLVIQIITGIFLSMNYIQSERGAFCSIIHIIRDINTGWLSRLVHSNTASLFFIGLIIHLMRGVFFGSFRRKKSTWLSGTRILIISIATAFFGYVLPWGQISYWGATVITNIASAIPYLGKIIVEWMWGNFSVREPTLNRFFSIHFLLPFVIVIIVLVHLILLHSTGSSNPIGSKEEMDKIEFHQEFSTKDTIFLITVLMMLIILISVKPQVFIDPENMNEANSIKAPVHIQPEWYFLFAYAILRSIPSKLGGIVALISSITVFYLIRVKVINTTRNKFSPWGKTKIAVFISSFIVLTFIGSKPVEEPYVLIRKVWGAIYFLSILL